MDSFNKRLCAMSVDVGIPPLADNTLDLFDYRCAMGTWFGDQEGGEPPPPPDPQGPAAGLGLGMRLRIGK